MATKIGVPIASMSGDSFKHHIKMEQTWQTIMRELSKITIEAFRIAKAQVPKSDETLISKTNVGREERSRSSRYSAPASAPATAT